jgi:HD-GYP domain-containing protein (c-di-GMP phosphodiesterase class II)
MSKELFQLKLATEKLTEGMYVAALDRPWTETPFLFQGFLIKSSEEVNKLREYCEHVFIDVERGNAPSDEDIGMYSPSGARAATGSSKAPAGGAKHKRSGGGEKAIPPAPIPPPKVHYQVEADVEEEIGLAKEAHKVVTEQVSSVLDDVRVGNKAQISELKRAVVQMEESILRNPDAFMWLRRLKSKDSYTYAHCIDASVLAIAFGRQLGMPRGQIQTLAIGALMFDMGKMKLPEELLSKPEALTDDEFTLMKKHVEFSVEIMRETKGVSEYAIEMAATHHERFDGSGYPNGASGGDIPLLGRVAGIVDFFDAVTSDRPYATARSPHEAIRDLYALRNTAFQDELIEQFIQTLGAYPVGTLVELSNGEAGIVIGQNRVRRLRPKVMVVLDSNKKPLQIAPTRDLMVETAADDGSALDIVKALEPGAYGIDPDEFYL